tara:strand:+ start:131 stop:394 length:264 start_codon:yes stop_codon:yes gene_type:complete
MIAFIIFLLGVLVGWALTRRRWITVERQKAKSEMNNEIDLRATPDNYLSEVQRMKKRYIEAKWQERVDWANKNRLTDSKFAPEHQKD